MNYLQNTEWNGKSDLRWGWKIRFKMRMLHFDRRKRERDIFCANHWLVCDWRVSWKGKCYYEFLQTLNIWRCNIRPIPWKCDKCVPWLWSCIALLTFFFLQYLLTYSKSTESLKPYVIIFLPLYTAFTNVMFYHHHCIYWWNF